MEAAVLPRLPANVQRNGRAERRERAAAHELPAIHHQSVDLVRDEEDEEGDREVVDVPDGEFVLIAIKSPSVLFVFNLIAKLLFVVFCTYSDVSTPFIKTCTSKSFNVLEFFHALISKSV